MESGVPQGSVLGPVLFLIFVNDLPGDIKSICKLFADDAKIYNIADRADVLQEDLSRLMNWSETWRLEFNIDKCKVMHFGHGNIQTDYKMFEKI